MKSGCFEHGLDRLTEYPKIDLEFHCVGSTLSRRVHIGMDIDSGLVHSVVGVAMELGKQRKLKPFIYADMVV